MKRLALLVLIACAASATFATASTVASFGISDFDGLVANQGGGHFTQAAGHPYEISTSFDLNTRVDEFGVLLPDGALRDAVVDLPAGFSGDPTATPRCAGGTAALLANSCPASSQVGVIAVRLSLQGFPFEFRKPIFNMDPTPGAAATFGFYTGFAVTLNAAVRNEGDHGLRVSARNVSQGLAVTGSTVTFWGTPADPSHDHDRGFDASFTACAETEDPACSNPAGVPARAFLSNPTSCAGETAGLTTRIHGVSWDLPPQQDEATFVSHDAPAYPALPGDRGPVQGPTGCPSVPFAPSLKVDPSSDAPGSPTGLSVDLHIPQGGLSNPAGLASGHLRKATITLPTGMVISPSGGGGLVSCQDDQLILGSSEPVRCPDASRIGSVEVETPVLEELIHGSVYIGRQRVGALPQDELIRIFLVLENRERGLVFKVPGTVRINPEDRVETTFDENPQLPFSNLRLTLKGGPRAPLALPRGCGDHTTDAELTSWSGRSVSVTSTFEIGGNGVPCPPPRFEPRLTAGSINPIAGLASPFALKVGRADVDEELAGLTVRLPRGLSAYLKGVPYCPETALDSVSSAEGGAALELTAPSCPAASQVGSVTVGAGPGTNPLSVESGKAYLAGPYRGAPLSLAVITPALAGPLDLGTVLVRTALELDSVTTQVTATTDPFPSNLHGIPLQLRQVRVLLDRPRFTLNPTNCDPMSVDAVVKSTQGSTHAPSSRYQVGNCAALKFKPKLRLAFKGKVHRRAHPSLRATLIARPGDANITRAQVKLPKAAFLDNSHIDGICSRVQFAARQCPKDSVYGYATATSPLLDYEVKGPVLLRANPAHKLPDLVVAFNGPERQPIAVELAGKTDSVKGALRNTFQAVPDVPVTKFSLTLFGGKKGLVEMSSGFCKSPRASVKLDAQSGATYDTRPRVRAKGCKRG